MATHVIGKQRLGKVAVASVLVALIAAGHVSAASPPALAFSPAAHDYGSLGPGASGSQTFVLANVGGAATGALSIALSGAAFSKTSDACSGTSLGPRKSCSITVAYTPSASGASDSGTLTARSRKPSATATVALSGRGAPPRHMYWTNYYANTIGRASVDGSAVEHSFITGARTPLGVAVGSSHVYWTNADGGTIGRASLDGSNVEQSFIVTGVETPTGIAVDATHVYWASWGQDGTIGRAKLDGSEVNPNFITGANLPHGLAVDAAYIYWVNAGATNTIGRASLDGSNVNQAFISGTSTQFTPSQLAVDSGYIYWTDFGQNSAIGRAARDGSNVIEQFISGQIAPGGVAVDGTHIYWSVTSEATVKRANLDGTNVSQGLIGGLPDGQYPESLAVQR